MGKSKIKKKNQKSWFTNGYESFMKTIKPNDWPEVTSDIKYLLFEAYRHGCNDACEAIKKAIDHNDR